MGNFLESGKIADVRSRSSNAQSGEFSSEQTEKYVVIESGRRTTSDTRRTTTTQVVQGRVQSLEESVDSGYEEPPDHQQSHLDELQLLPELRQCVCRTDRVLGEHHSYLGYRFIQFDPDCEGNRHITNEDL